MAPCRRWQVAGRSTGQNPHATHDAYSVVGEPVPAMIIKLYTILFVRSNACLASTSCRTGNHTTCQASRFIAPRGRHYADRRMERSSPGEVPDDRPRTGRFSGQVIAMSESGGIKFGSCVIVGLLSCGFCWALVGSIICFKIIMDAFGLD